MISEMLSILTQVASSRCNFPRNLSGVECWGLSPAAADAMGHPITTLAACEAACCAHGVAKCTIWNFHPKLPDPPSCWHGLDVASAPQCKPITGWVGGMTEPTPTPPPTMPSGPRRATLPLTVPAAKPLPFTLDTVRNPKTGEVFGANSKGFTLNGTAWYPISGEVHFARLAESTWREQLMRMRAGGLDMIAVYVFWIHHEEARGVFTWDGRRNVSKFLTIAAELGFKVLLRIGPWDHGEARNGGHPDWVLSECGCTRSTDSKYLACASDWYGALAAQVQGLWWKQGGPIVAVQVDNETSDWKYLLALKDLASQTTPPMTVRQLRRVGASFRLLGCEHDQRRLALRPDEEGG